MKTSQNNKPGGQDPSKPSEAGPDTVSKRVGYHHGDLRAQLIEATRQLVEEKGPDNFSVSEACRRAGVSTAAPYKHFKDKGEMLRHVSLAGMQRQSQMMINELSQYEPGSLKRIVALGRVYTRFAQQEPGVFRLMFGLADDHDQHAEMIEFGDQKYSMVQSECALFYGRTEVQEIDRRRAFLLWSFVHGLSFLRIDGKLQMMEIDYDFENVLEDIARRVMID